MNRNAFIFALIMSMTLAGTTFSQDFSVDFSYMSRYVWRGAVFDENAVLQSSLTGNMGNLSVNLWGNMNLTGENDRARKMNEWDYTVDYSAIFNTIGLSVGIVGFTFPNSGGPGTTEIYAGATLDVIGTPSLTVFQDVDLVEGTYISLGGGYCIPVGGLTTIDLGASLGYGSGEMNQALYSPVSGAGLADMLVSASATIPLTGVFSVTPCVILTSILDSDGQDAYDEADRDYTNVLFCLTTSAAF